MWQRSDNRLKSLTIAKPTASMFQLPSWPNPPDDTETADRAQLIAKVLSEMKAQMKAMKDEVIAAEASRRTTHGKSAKGSNQDAKDPEKQPKPKLK